jgi:hypothetical protein
MKLIALSMVATMFMTAQQSRDTDAAHPVDAPLHADILTLVQLEGTRQKMEANIKQVVELGKDAMIKASSRCSAAFAEEWGKRMLARIRIDDFVNAEVSAYERHLNDVDVRELIALTKQQKASPGTAVPSPQLKQKLESVFPSIQSEMMGADTQIGAKLGAEIGQEVEKEHPEYCSEANTPAK